MYLADRQSMIEFVSSIVDRQDTVSKNIAITILHYVIRECGIIIVIIIMAQQPLVERRRQIKNPISISDMRDAVVDEGTYSKYVNDIIPFLDWLCAELPDWLTTYCHEQHAEIILLRENEGKKMRQKRIKMACFFAFTWQLACRSNNTARIRYGHISWVFLCNARVVSTHQNAAEESMLLQPFQMV